MVASGGHFSKSQPLQIWVYATPCHGRIKYNITIRGDAMLTRAVSSMSTLQLRQVADHVGLDLDLNEVLAVVHTNDAEATISGTMIMLRW